MHKFARLLTLVLSGYFCITFAHAGDKYEHKSYDKKLVKSRAAKGYDNNGTVIYNYQEVDEYTDELDDETIGVIELEGGVREINNVIIIKGDVESEKDHLKIGTVTGESSDDVTVNNSVTIEGGVNAENEGISLGTVRVGGADEVSNEVEVGGDIQN